MFNRDDEESEESEDISVDEEPEFAPPETPEPEEIVDEWKPRPYPENRRGLFVS